VVRQESSDFETVVLSEEATGKLLEARIVDLSPAPTVRATSTKDLNEHSSATLEEAERKFTIIKPLLDLPDRTKTDVRAVADEYGIHYTTLYKWIRHFESTGKLSVFVRQPRADKGSSVLEEETEKIISEIIEASYLTKQQRKPAKIIREVHKACARLSVKPPIPTPFEIASRLSTDTGRQKPDGATRLPGKPTHRSKGVSRGRIRRCL
jgi:putative transposase